MILLRGTRFSQPIGAAEIDYGNPLSLGLIQAVSGGATSYSCGNFSIASSKKTATTYGLAESTVLNQLLPATQKISGSNSSFTLLSVELVSSSVAATAGIYKLGNASNAARAWVSSANGTTAGAISASIYLGGNRTLGGSFVKPVGSMYIGVLRHRHGVGASLFVDGAEDPVKALFTNTSLGHGFFGVRDAATDGANALSVVWNRALSNAEIAEISSNPWQLFRPVHRRIYFDMGAGGGSVVGNASGALVSIGLDSATATASGSTVIPATGTASLAAISLIASQSGAYGVGSASSALDSVGLTSANATASGGTSIPATGSGALVGISLASTQGLANGSALASAALENVSLTAATGSASAGTSIPGNASASLASASITPASAQATAAATAAGPIVGMNLTPAQAQAASEAWASAQLAAIGLTASTGTANNLPNDFEPADQWRTLTIERSQRIMSARYNDRVLQVQHQNRTAKA